MITEKEQSQDELPEPIDLKMDLPPEMEEKKDKKTKEKKETEIIKKKETLEELVEKNIKWSKAIYLQNKKIKGRLNMMVFVNYLKLVVIVAPIIIAIIYLPPLIGQYMKQLDSLLGGMPEGANFGEMLLEGFGLDGVFSNLTPEQTQQAQDAAKK
ncbi:MAG: hypothetical protein A2301_02830 [Candidatus Magasanikbacteria bacterium RIFOXYB2_FULL_40_13]|uniref:Uncharacterized protein n=1 Tax=Candidatus Magasanikbacteria bacterium RIFOXYA1_FULL_40_8 TaxID=1798694 RepID=A0A1F6NTT8_9BACT|nr:MAG: hypothetical protein A2301_02830 [Candidatus Magasanikbacteria bacterium RIFOXYB2_FULL_40_13]OGH87044.1 MAG: hypothetical protein A2206_00450 [Candidatus Magasanikbacteria bacterium RIFOXYA1_FULL_40_8]